MGYSYLLRTVEELTPLRVYKAMRSGRFPVYTFDAAKREGCAQFGILQSDLEKEAARCDGKFRPVYTDLLRERVKGKAVRDAAKACGLTEGDARNCLWRLARRVIPYNGEFYEHTVKAPSHWVDPDLETPWQALMRHRYGHFYTDRAHAA